MKLKVLKGVLAFFIVAAVAAWNVNLDSKTESIFDVTLANIVALAQGESGSSECHQYISQTNHYGYCDGVPSWIGAQLSYDCRGGGSNYCTEGYDTHVYDCDGTWLGHYGSTQLTTCYNDPYFPL